MKGNILKNALLFLFIFLLSSCNIPSNHLPPEDCQCGCEECRCANADRIFHIKTSDIINIRIENLDMRTLAILADDSPEENQVVDLLNSFTPEEIRPAEEVLGASYAITINFHTYYRLYNFTEDSICLGDSWYTSDGYFAELVKLADNAPKHPE